MLNSCWSVTNTTMCLFLFVKGGASIATDLSQTDRAVHVNFFNGTANQVTVLLCCVDNINYFLGWPIIY